MNKKYLYTALVGFAIAFNPNIIQAQEGSSNKPTDTIFVCSTQQGAPTMFAYNPGEVNLTSLMTWHAEYLLPEQSGSEVCQQTATKLQASIDARQEKYIKAQVDKTSNSVCLVSEEDQTCNTPESEKLFSVNPDYKATCVLDNKKPIECMALNVRGNIYSFEDKPYQAMWWPW